MSAPDVAPDGRARGRDLLVEFPQEELIAKWEEFFDEAGYQSRIIAVADRYPEERSLEVSFEHLNRFDTDMAIYLLRHPLNVLMAGEEAIRRLSPPGEEVLQIHLRIKGLPRDRRVQIRDLRAKHLGQYITVEGLVRKSTEVRPRVVGALFQCLRCGTILKEEQDGQAFREPLECYEEQGGCKRSASATKFKLLMETSLYLDTQKIEIQEAPEGLRGGAEPQRLTAYVEDDLTGHITPGQRLILNGILRSVQKGRPGAKSTLFDIFVDVNSVEMEQVEFEEIEVTEEDARLIREAGSDPDIVRMMVNSIAPSIYGMHTEKEALALQLFSGVPKKMPDGRRIRGDIHLILVGDPGTAKSELLSYMSRLSPRGIYATGKAASAAGLCVGGESIIVTDRGMTPIEELARPYFPDPVRQRPLETRAATGEITTFDDRHAMVTRPLEAMWRVKAAPFLLRVVTASGLSLRVTPATKLLVDHAMGQSWIRAKFLRKGMRVATARALPPPAQPHALIIDLLRTVDSRIVVTVAPELVDRILRGLQTRDGTLREAARKLLLDEDALYHRWRNERHTIPLVPLLRAARAAGLMEEDVASSIRVYSQAGGHRIKLPVYVDEDLAYFGGLIAGDGSVEGAMGGFSIRFSNSDAALMRSYGELVRSLFNVSVDFTPQRPLRAASSRFHSKLVATLLRALGVPTSPKSASLTIPDLLLNASDEVLSSFLRGLYDTDGTVGGRKTGGACVSLSTTSLTLARRVQIALLRFGICARIRTRQVAGRQSVRRDGKVIVSKYDRHVLDIYGWSSLALFKQHIGFRHPKKAARLGSLRSRIPHSNVDIISSAGQHLEEVREALGLTPAEAYGPRARFGKVVESGRMDTGHESLTALLDSLEERYRSRAWRGPRVRLPPHLLDRTVGFLRTRGLGPKALADLLAISAASANDYFLRTNRPRSPTPVIVLRGLWLVLRVLAAPMADEVEAEIRPVLRRIEKVMHRLVFIRTLASSDIRWEPVQAAELIPSDGEPTLYDLTVRDAHAFVANGILVHNTAAAVRDEFGEGRWTLEAGALVLADKGLACIDEIDKMNPQDRSAIHEALEQQRVSVAKAGITAVLQARCAVLAAANPKFGRFDEHKYIAEQIDLPPALLSRFDIIFSLIDRPEAERDRQMADHILRGHKVGEIVRRQEEGLTAPTMKGLEEPYTPHFSPDFLRKYVAFAKRIYPVMTDEVMEIIKKKYLDIRKTGEAAGSSVPITPRQLEAIIRLSEASARLRLSETVSVEDAERSIRIVEYWMGKVAGEEGRFDIDIIQTGISQSQREQIIALRDIISELAGPEGVADYEDIVRVAQDRGIPPARVDAWLKRWAQEGEIYSPAKNKYKLVERL